MARLSAVVIAIVLVLAGVPAVAAPTHLVATSGVVSMGTTTPAPFSDISIVLAGPDFTLTNDLFRSEFQPNDFLAYYAFNPVGTLLDLKGHANLLPGSNTVLVLAGVASEVVGRIDLFLPLVPVSLTPLSVPFTLTGELQGVGIDATLGGGGVATIAFAGFDSQFSPQSVQLVVTPEPSVFLPGLAGAGTLLIFSARAARAHRKRHR